MGFGLSSGGGFPPSPSEEISARQTVYVERVKLTHEACVTWAQSVVKSGFVLNGGALIALPAIAGLVKDAVTLDPSRIANSALAFAAGLIAAWFAGISAYVVSCWAERTASNNVELVALDVYIRNGVISYVEQAKMLRLAIKRDAAKYKFVRYMAMLLCFISVAAFCLGNYLAYPALKRTNHSVASSSQQSIQECFPSKG